MTRLQPYRQVVPHAGTWIEIEKLEYVARKCNVVPHAGTWIEMYFLGIIYPL